jgi:hypothetical protein
MTPPEASPNRARPETVDPLDLWIDRIVDGELSPRQLREAVELLEHAPDGWRRCALAFLEAQCWADALRVDDLETGTPTTDRLPHSAPRLGEDCRHLATIPNPKWRTGGILRPLAIAASVAFASFSLGWASHAARSGLPALSPIRPEIPHIASASTSGGPATADPAPIPTLPALPDRNHGQSPRADPSSASASIPTIQEVATVQLVSPIDPSQSAEVPILGGPGIGDAATWIANQPPPVSEHTRAILQRQGYRVDQDRSIIATTLDDGRQIAVPVDQVQLRYVGLETL